MINLTVFCSSKDNINNDFHLEIQNFIKLLDVNKFNIVYGGGTCGLMGTVRKTFIESVASFNKVKSLGKAGESQTKFEPQGKAGESQTKFEPQGKAGESQTKFEPQGKACGKIISSNVTKFIEPDIEDDYIFDNINERQRKLIDLGDTYLILPGGYGTCSEMFEVMTKNDIGESSKPIFIFNCFEIFDNLINLFDNLKFNGLITRDFNKIKVTINSNPIELADIINNYNFI